MAGRLKEPLRTAGTAVWVCMAMSSRSYEFVEVLVTDGPKAENSDNPHKGYPGGAEKGAMPAYLADLAAKSSQDGALGAARSAPVYALLAAARTARRTSVSKIGSLYSFFVSALAPESAARAAARAIFSSTTWPRSAASAALARCGTGAAAPRTIEARRQAPSDAASRTTATSARGQSKESLSPCLM